MIRRSLKSAILVFAVLLACTWPSAAQVPIGVPLFGSFSGGPDIVNNADLNAHWQFPIRQKAGLVPFYYILTYDSAVWSPAGTSGSQYWQPAPNWGWQVLTPLVMGSVTFSQTQESCNDLHGDYYYYNLYSNFVFTDPAGTVHVAPSGFSVSDKIDAAPQCKPGGRPLSANSQIYDDYGYTISASISTGDFDGSDYYPTVTIYTRSGGVLTPYISSYEPNPQTPNLTDNNGNSISESSSSGTTTYTDSLGTTALTVSGNGTPSSPVALNYTGGNGSVTAYVNYTNYTVQTNFGCTGVSDLGPWSTYLVSSITMADGSSYGFQYEVTPNDNHNPHYVTGRLASVTLPTGGTISYQYKGSNNGIVCADGSTATLWRSTPDTGLNYWQYAHSENGPQWTTVITDPQNNVTTYNFQQAQGSQNLYETERQVGSLETVITCYNDLPSNCASGSNGTTGVVPWGETNS